jgi:hypothetical protein
MGEAAWNGRGQNVNDIIVFRVAAPFSEVHNVAEPAKNR